MHFIQDQVKIVGECCLRDFLLTEMDFYAELRCSFSFSNLTWSGSMGFRERSKVMRGALFGFVAFLGSKALPQVLLGLSLSDEPKFPTLVRFHCLSDSESMIEHDVAEWFLYWLLNPVKKKTVSSSHLPNFSGLRSPRFCWKKKCLFCVRVNIDQGFNDTLDEEATNDIIVTRRPTASRKRLVALGYL